jgi:hypothetical protein
MPRDVRPHVRGRPRCRTARPPRTCESRRPRGSCSARSHLFASPSTRGRSSGRLLGCQGAAPPSPAPSHGRPPAVVVRGSRLPWAVLRGVAILRLFCSLPRGLHVLEVVVNPGVFPRHASEFLFSRIRLDGTPPKFPGEGWPPRRPRCPGYQSGRPRRPAARKNPLTSTRRHSSPLTGKTKSI